MKMGVVLGHAGLLFAVCGMSCLGDVTQQDTTGPNRFEFTQTEYVVAEDATNAIITVRFHPGHRGVYGQVAFHTLDGTAVANEDYIEVTNTLYFSGWGPRSFSVPIVWDDLRERDETVHLRLLPGFKTVVGPDAVLRIRNVPRTQPPPPESGTARPGKKRRPPIVTLSVTEPTAVEGGDGAAALVVRRSNGIENPLTVYYRVTGSARNGVDYENLEGSVVIPAGSHEATIEIIPLDDELQEGTERVAVHLKAAPRHERKYRPGAAQRRVLEILDND